MSKNFLSVEVESRGHKKIENLKAIRKSGQIPGVVFGDSQDSKNIKFAKKAWLKLMNSNTLAFNAKLDGKEQLVMISKVEGNHLGAPIHISLQRVKRNQKSEIVVPVKLIGERESSDQGMVQLHTSEVKISANPSDIPNSIDIDITKIVAGDSIRGKDLVLASGIELIDVADDDLFLDCQIQRISEEEEVADLTETEPEIVGETEEKKE